MRNFFTENVTGGDIRLKRGGVKRGNMGSRLPATHPCNMHRVAQKSKPLSSIIIKSY